MSEEEVQAPTRNDADAAEQVRQVDLADIHDFATKLTQESVIDCLRDYVKVQAQRRNGSGDTNELRAPISINLDLTTACNYACDHCVDMDILNKGIRFDPDQLIESLTNLAARGLRSVILIGGGEPTVHPRFAAVVRHLKALGMAIGIVTNGSRLDRVQEIADVLTDGDWVRLSLDSGTDATFQAMHKPRRPVTLEQICAGVPKIKEINPRVSVGFSFIITWRDCVANETSIHENIGEMVEAARLAKANGFDYISYKPFLVRVDVNNAEVVEVPDEQGGLTEIRRTIRSYLDRAHLIADENFRVVESTNLLVLERNSASEYTNQPRTCHMAYFRQVVSPLGVFSCPVYRNVPAARIGEKDHYADTTAVTSGGRATLTVIDTFDASTECRAVTCLYNHANWFVEDLVQHPEKLAALKPSPDRRDYFL
jgi:organic radical activating enzyme